MRVNKILILLFITSLLQACLPPTQIEESAIINTRGVDLIEENGQIIVETSIIPYIFDPQSQDITEMLVGRGQTIKEAREDAGRRASFRLTPGQIRLELYGKEAAERGILTFLTGLIRDARVSDMMLLAVTNQNAKEVLESEQSAVKVNTAQYLEDLVTKETTFDTLPKNSLHEFARMIEQVGIDPVLPVIDVIENFPTLTGAALFSNDVYVGGISLQEAFLINQMKKRVKNTALNAKIPTENYLDNIAYIGGGEKQKSEDEFIHLHLSLIKGNSKVKLLDKEKLHFKAEINMEAELLESSILFEIKTEEISKKIERDIEAFFTKQYEDLFSKLQELNSDAFGLGKHYTSTRQGSKVTDEEWHEKFPEITIEFDVKFEMLSTGVID